MMIRLCIGKLRYPEWFDIENKAADNEDEEKFLELKQDLISFLEPMVTVEHFKNYIVTFVD